MASPLKSIGDFLFGGTGGNAASPMLMAPSMPSTPPPLQQPQGSPTSNAPSGTASSFLSSAAPVATAQQTATKSLLGQ